jgi:hypothetical protein
VPPDLERLVNWIVQHINLVALVSVAVASFVLPIFRRMAEARERSARGEQVPPADGGRGGPLGRPGGPREFDWGKWLEQMQRRAGGEEEAERADEEAPEKRPSAPPPASPKPVSRSLEAEVDEEKGPVWKRRPLTEMRPLTEASPLTEAEPLTAARPPERAPLTRAVPLTDAAPLTDIRPYDDAEEPEAVGTLEPGRVETVEDAVYAPDLSPDVTALERPSEVSSLDKEKPASAPAAATPAEAKSFALIPGALEGWTQAFIASEILGRPVALRDPGEGVAPGLR